MPIIYAIYASPCHLPYYGSSIKTLAQRKTQHKKNYNKFKRGIGNECFAYKLFNAVGFENCIFETVECLPDDFTKKQILECEKFWIQNNGCINKNRPVRTEEEKKLYNRKYRKDNCEKMKEQMRKYRIEKKL